MLSLTETGVAAVIAAACSGVAAILGSIALILQARGRRRSAENLQPANGRTLAQTVERIEADLAEHIWETENAGHRSELVERMRRERRGERRDR